MDTKRQNAIDGICHVEGVKQCAQCASQDIVYRVICNPPNHIIVRAVCRECDYSWSLPHIENLMRRTNTTLSHWRMNVLKRDGYQCRICGSKDELNAHHIIPVGVDKEKRYVYDVNNGITLCKKCHGMIPTSMK